MKKRIWFFEGHRLVSGLVEGLLILAVLGLTSSTAFGANEYKYQRTYDNKTTDLTWSVQKMKDKVIISTLNDGYSSTSVCTPQGRSSEWKLRDATTGYDLQAVLQRNLLNITGNKKGKLYRDTLNLGSKPWYQEPFYSLRSFLQSSGNALSFWSMRIDDTRKLKPFELEATKQGEEMITYGGQQVLTEKIEIRNVGSMAYIWNDTLWFRKSDKLLLKYHSIHGFPGVATVVIELIDGQ